MPAVPPPCDVDGCPRKGLNELPIKSYDPVTGATENATALVCDQDFRAAHDAAIAYTLGMDKDA